MVFTKAFLAFGIALRSKLFAAHQATNKFNKFKKKMADETSSRFSRVTLSPPTPPDHLVYFKVKAVNLFKQNAGENTKALIQKVDRKSEVQQSAKSEVFTTAYDF